MEENKMGRNDFSYREEESRKSEIQEGLEAKVPRWIPNALLGTIAGIALLTSVYIVRPSQEGVVTRLGKYVRTEESGPHLKIPLVEGVTKPSVTEVRRLEIGFRTTGSGSTAEYVKHPEESLMLTGDENIVQSEIIVQYKIKDSKDYLFNVKDVERTIMDAAEAAHRQVVGNNAIDRVLTDGKTEIQTQTMETIQLICDKYKMGVDIVAVQLQDVYAPEQVKAEFEDVASAKEDQVAVVNAARGYQNEKLPLARGDSAALVQQALGYKEQRINIAEGDVSRFNSILKEYRKAPKITEDRLYLEKMGEFYKGKDVIIIADGPGTYRLLDLNKTLGGGVQK
jgi:membrane protease subunit HflK